MRTRIEFPAGVEALDGARACILERFAEDALCVVLESEDCPDARLLLGDVARVMPGYRLSPDEAAGNRCGFEQGGACEVYCRLCIPNDKPQDAGFDLNHLILLNAATHQGMELERHGQGVIPFSAMKAVDLHGPR